MANYFVHIMGQSQPLLVDLPFDCIESLTDFVTQARFLPGHLSSPDESGVCKKVMIAAGRVQLIVEAN